MSHPSQALVAAAAAALLLCGQAARAAEAAPAPTAAPATAQPAAPHPKKMLKVLTSDQVDPARLLPPPPADGSAAQKEDLAEMERAYRQRSDERYAQAKWDDTHESPELFAPTLGPAFDLARLPATAKLLALVQNEGDVSASMAKRYFQRMRPWAIDATVTACDYQPGANPKTSYPSGHAVLSYSVGLVLADLMPEKSQLILARAADYAYSREVCGAHYPLDIQASHVLGTAVALQLLASPKMAPMLQDARAELQAAGLTGAPRMAQAAPSGGRAH